MRVIVTGINPEPWTAPEASVGRKGGRVFPRLHSSAALKHYKQAVADTVKELLPKDFKPTDEPISLTFYFWRQLPDYEADTKKVRKNQADATNMQKATEDALQRVLFTNDRNVADVHSYIMEQTAATEPLIVIDMIENPDRPEIKIEKSEDLFGDMGVVVDDRAGFEVEDVF